MKKIIMLVAVLGVLLFSVACSSVSVESEITSEESVLGSYKLNSQLYVDEDKHIEISYPKVIGYKDDLVEKFLNQSIEDITEVYGYYSKYKNVEISYDIAEKDDDRLSIIFSGTAKSDGEKIIQINETLSFDLKTSNGLVSVVNN